MKHEILKWIEADKSFDTGVRLYQKYGKNIGFKTVLNRQGYSKHNEGVLHEELRKLTDLSHAEFVAYFKAPIKNIPAPAVENKKPELPVERELDLTELPTEELIKKVPEEVKKTIRLRDDFPFLKSTDCPAEFKILVADMISAYENYKSAHAALFAPDNEDKLTEIAASVVENYIENRMIWDELEYYKANAEIFGAHPIFAELERFKELRSLSTADLYKKMENLRIGILKDKKKISEDPENVLQSKWREALSRKESDMSEVKRILNINE